MKRDGQVWALVPTGGPCERMGPTFVGHVGVDVLDSPMGPLGLLGLISQFIQFTLFNPYPHFPYNSQQNQPCDEIVARNCLGAGRASKARAIEKLGQKENPDIVFPFETKAHAPRKKKFKKIFVLVEALVLM